jgi:hypothetical protein
MLMPSISGRTGHIYIIALISNILTVDIVLITPADQVRANTAGQDGYAGLN